MQTGCPGFAPISVHPVGKSYLISLDRECVPCNLTRCPARNGDCDGSLGGAQIHHRGTGNTEWIESFCLSASPDKQKPFSVASVSLWCTKVFDHNVKGDTE